jgi:uncharacterized protein (DUF2249 family)
MVRGGKREGSGRKSVWKHGETQAIRVPKAFVPQLLEIARKLDAGEAIEIVESLPPAPLDESLEQMTLFGELKVQFSSQFGPLSGRALSSRLKVRRILKPMALEMSHSDFAEWTRKRDPDGVAWEYRKDDRKFYPIEPVLSF